MTPGTVAAHAVHFGRELAGVKDRCTPPGRHRGEVGVLGHDEQRANLSGGVQDPIVLMVTAVVHGHEWVNDAASAVVGRLRQQAEVQLDLVFCPLERPRLRPTDSNGLDAEMPDRSTTCRTRPV
jgi:hypothetical protein